MDGIYEILNKRETRNLKKGLYEGVYDHGRNKDDF